jgi:hypothetical protein
MKDDRYWYVNEVRVPSPHYTIRRRRHNVCVDRPAHPAGWKHVVEKALQ